MHPHVTRVVVAVLSAALSSPGVATLIRDGHGTPGNPPVMTGGQSLRPQPAPPVPYSVVGAAAREENWLMRVALWPWRVFHLRSSAAGHDPGSPVSRAPPAR